MGKEKKDENRTPQSTDSQAAVRVENGVGVNAPTGVALSVPVKGAAEDGVSANAASGIESVPKPKPAMEGMPKLVSTEQAQQLDDVTKNPWLVGQIVEDGVVKNFTWNEIKKQHPDLTPGQMLNSIARYRQKEGLPALTISDWKEISGGNDLDKSYKQVKRDRVRNILADSIQPVADVLKAAVAYGYGKAGRTFIPARTGQVNGPGLGERMRRLEEVRAAQNWDAWADTFRNKERERLQQEAEARRAAAREEERQQGIQDRRTEYIWKSQYDAAHRPKTREDEVYEEFRSQGKSPSEAVALMYGLTHGRNRAGGIGGSGGGRGKSKARYYKVGNKKYPESQIEKALKHAYNIKNPNADATDIKEWFESLTPLQQEKYLEENATLIEE